jgi:hypothetical protein
MQYPRIYVKKVIVLKLACHSPQLSSQAKTIKMAGIREL